MCSLWVFGFGSVPPSNDTPCGVTFLGTPTLVPTIVNFDLTYATVDAREVNPGIGSLTYGNIPSPSCDAIDGWCATETNVQNSVWYGFIAPASGNVKIVTTGGNTQIAIWDSYDCSDYTAFSEVYANDNAIGNAAALGSCIGLNLTPFGFYWIQVDGYLGAAVIGTLSIKDAGLPGTSPFIQSVNKTNASCNGVCDGSLNLTVSGGVPPYTYEWSNNSQNEDIANLCPGAYRVTVTDDNGCSVTSAFYTIAAPAPATIISNPSPACGTTIVNLCANYLFSSGFNTGTVSLKIYKPDGSLANTFSYAALVPTAIAGGFTVCKNNYPFPADEGLYKIVWNGNDNCGNLLECIIYLYKTNNSIVKVIIDETLGPVTGLQNIKLKNIDCKGTQGAGCGNSGCECTTPGTIKLIGPVSINNTGGIDIKNTTFCGEIIIRNSIIGTAGKIKINNAQLCSIYTIENSTVNEEIKINNARITAPLTFSNSTINNKVTINNSSFSFACTFNNNLVNKNITFNNVCTPCEINILNFTSGFTQDFTYNGTIGCPIVIYKWAGDEIQEEAFESEIVFYPNPSSGIFNLAARQLIDIPIEVFVYDMAGRQIFQKNYMPSEVEYKSEIDLTSHAEGIYFVKMNWDAQVRTEKLILRK